VEVEMHKTIRNILVIDDDKLFCDAIVDYFSDETMNVFAAHTGKEGLRVCSQHQMDVVLLDQKLPDVEGVSLFTSILKHHDQTKIIFITAYPSFDNAVEAIKMGAYDYLSKPFALEELKLAIERALRTLELERIEQLHSYRDDKESEEAVLISGQGGFSEILAMIDVAAATDAPVLITGETGTGKSVVARSIHYQDLSHTRVFICINCAALPENLIEAELFGCEKGAFTGAVTARKGIFELAEGGTLFLDEIGAMPLHLQSKLLGVLEDKRIRRIGGESVKRVDVRIIAASNTDLEKAVEMGTFREDLYYRLSVIRICIPPLRERREDIPELCDHFLRTMAQGRSIDLPHSEVEKLMAYDWPGNVRELKNVIERSLIIQPGSVLRPSKFLNGGSAPSSVSSSSVPGGNGIIPLEEVEKNYIQYAFDTFAGNYTRAARALGISLSTLKRKVKGYNIISSGFKMGN
jgi:DNA-binding NtrC family response regulator